MRRAVESVAFWGFQLAFGGLFATVFVFVVPQAVEGRFFQGLSVALGGCVGFAVALGLVVTAWAWWSGPPAAGEPGECPHCGQPLPLDHVPVGEPGTPADIDTPEAPRGSSARWHAATGSGRSTS